jgi:1-acyl-sn-glycerol-3-phosphate acyltransferase
MFEHVQHLLLDQIDRRIPAELSALVDSVSQGVNVLGYDKWGFSPAVAKRTLLLAEWFYRHYFRVEVHGIERVPPGRGLLIGNHSSQLAYDGMMMATAMLLDAKPPRAVKAMIEKVFQKLPIVNVLMTRAGQVTGLPENCERLLEEDNLLMVFPEGARGSGKVWKDRYKLVDFGTGFMRLALKMRAPITPFAFVGGEEACPAFVDIKPLARLFGLPYFPITPMIVPLPLPARCSIWFGEPMFFEGTGNEEDAEVEAKVDLVKKRIRELIDEGLAARQSVFF